MEAAMRRSDAIFRWGGEEFAVLVVSSSYRGAERLAETLRRIVAEHQFPGVGALTGRARGMPLTVQRDLLRNRRLGESPL